MESMRQKLSAIAHIPLGRDNNRTSFGQPGNSRPSASAPRPVAPIEILDSDEEEAPSSSKTSKAPAPPNNLYDASRAGQNSMQIPTAYVNGRAVGVPSPFPLDAPAPNPSSRPPPPPQRIAAPSSYASTAPTISSSDVQGEDFQIDTRPEYEEATTQTEAENAMKDLLSGAVGSLDFGDIDMADAIVDGFDSKFRLMPHQIQGRIWMRERESGKKFGGILADMGLGKTIQTLARIVEGKPSREDLRGTGLAKTTLIVCPLALLPQWEEECHRMAPGLEVIRHYGASKSKSPELIKRADVIITTYQTVVSEFKTWGTQGADHTATNAKSKAKDPESDEESDDSLIGKSIKKKAPAKKAPKSKAKPCFLFDLNFYRIVLDEAQNIKNRTSKTAQACFALNGRFRWVLTGTPIQNKVDELFSLIKFLRIRPLNDWDSFSTHIVKPIKAGRSKSAMKRLHVVLNAIMLRRTKDQKINGEPIIKLPARDVEVVVCQFDKEERRFYEALEDRTSATMKKYKQEGNLEKNYTSVLILLLRLRQACDHPALLSKDMMKDIEALNTKAPSSQQDDEEDEKQGVDELAGLLDNLGISKAATCNICLTPLPKGWKDVQCEDCHNSVGVVARRKSILSSTKKNRILDSDDEEEDSNLPPSSSKIRETLKILDDIYARTKGKRDDDGNKIPAEKTIVFSQFTTMLDMLEPFLIHAGVRYTRYDGSMKAPDREEALNKIRHDKRCRVILISFKAGGVGLNLTACNNVILVDLWWNPALEDQAFDRAHRLGQTKPVSIYKLTIENTVENRILDLQNEKRLLAAAAYSGGKLSGKGGLDLQDMLKLFTRFQKDDEDDDSEDDE